MHEFLEEGAMFLWMSIYTLIHTLSSWYAVFRQRVVIGCSARNG